MSASQHGVIRMGLIGAGYMGKRHSVAMQSVGAVFNTPLRPVCEMIATSNADSAARAGAALGFNRHTSDWRELVADPAVEAIVIASPQSTHREIALAALAAGKPVLCEKPLGASLQDAQAMTQAAKDSGVVAMVGFNYIRTPASVFARKLIADGAIGELTFVRAEHTEDFLADPESPATWRTQGDANGTLGDLAPHIINAALALVGPIKSVFADVETVHTLRPGKNGAETVSNDDHAHALVRFERGTMGHLYFSRIATGRKMGYAYEITGTDGAIRFDQEDQNALWLYTRSDEEATAGFKKILTNPQHGDYGAFCEGPGHGTGYQDQLIIEMRDFIAAINDGTSQWPSFDDGLAVSRVVAACRASARQQRWAEV
jgi:predicted dehydrogenase